MESITANHQRTPRQGWHLEFLITTAFCLVAATAGGQEGDLQVDVTNARRIPCPDHISVADRSLAQAQFCFTAEATAQPELRLESTTPEMLREVVITRHSAAGGTGTSQSMQPQSEQTVWTGSIPLPFAATGKTPSPDAPLLSKPTGSFGSFFQDAGKARALATGHHLLDVVVGSGTDLHHLVLGLTITSSGKTDAVQQWSVAEGLAQLVLGGCWQRSLDPIVDLVLTDCEDPRYQIKVATANPQGKLSLEHYVANSRAAYQTIWFGISQQNEAGPPETIVLEFEQSLGGTRAAIRKFFVAAEDRFLVITFYGPEGQQQQLRSRVGALGDWLLLR